MGHIGEHAGAVVVGCKVLPIFNDHGIVDGAMKKIVHRIDGRKAVARVKELLKRAAQARPHSPTVSGKKWKEGSEFPSKGWRCSDGRTAGGRRLELQLEQAELQVGRGQLLVGVVSSLLASVVRVCASEGGGADANAVEKTAVHVEAVVGEPAERIGVGTGDCQYVVQQPKEHGGGRRLQLQGRAMDHHRFRLCGVGALITED
ncbi:hypothetical protein ACP4OV_017053 [Aristida adscensionis]